MYKLINPGRIIFATGLIAFGILCMLSKDFIIGRPPSAGWAASIPGKIAWAYLSGSLCIIAGLAIIFNLKPGIAAAAIGILILLCSFLLRHLYEMSDWLNAYKSLALGGGAFIVAASYLKKEEGKPGNSRRYEKLVFTGCIFISLFLINCGIAHFKFYQFVKDFIPAYIPFRGFWAIFCGICLLAGGAGLFIRQTSRWAALLSGIMVAGWFLLLHIPRFIANTKDASDRMGLAESFALAGIFFVLAGILSGKR